MTLTEAKVLIEAWRKEYNETRPHSALGYRPPAPEARMATTLTQQLVPLSGAGQGQLGNPILASPILFAGTSGIAAFITGLISIVKRKERSIAVYFAVTYGLVVLVFWLRVITFPH